MNTLQDTELAYIAGIVDGEGSVYIYLKTGGNQRGERKKYHRSALKIANTDKSLIDWLRERIGGTVSRNQPKSDKYKVVYHLAIEGPSLLTLIDALSPFLLLKQKQMQLVAQMQQTMRTVSTGLALDPSVLAERDRIYKEFLQCKHGESMSWGGRNLYEENSHVVREGLDDEISDAAS
ncbi:MAG: LAGLIDADG family homing endonuclease [Ktedonobacterales bacterium]